MIYGGRPVNSIAGERIRTKSDTSVPGYLTGSVPKVADRDVQVDDETALKQPWGI